MGTTTSGLQAQPAPGGGFGGGPGGPNGAPPPPDFRNLTPEQRQALADEIRDLMREKTMRLMLENAGFTDKAVQDPIIAFSLAQENATQALRDKNGELMRAANDQTSTNGQIGALLNQFTGGVEDETARRKTALAALDAKINYSTQPRLAAVLTLLGLTGDEMAVVEGAAGGGRGGMRGGFGGGGFGGPGGGGFGGPGPGGGGPGFGGPGGGQGGPGGGPGFGGAPGGGQGGANQGGQGGNQRGGRGGRDRQGNGNQPAGA